MKQVRILKSNAEDLRLLEYFVRASGEDTKTWAHFQLALYKSNPNVVIVAEVEDDDRLNKVLVGYTVNAAWRTQNILPYWISGRMKFLVSDDRTLNQQVEELARPMALYMELLGYYSFYMARLVPSTITWSNVGDYLERGQRRTNSIDRYDSRLEALINTPADLEYQSEFYKMISFKEWPSHRKVAIIRHDLKYEHVAQYK